MTLDTPLHSIIVHFPIALLIVGFVVDASGVALKTDWLTRAGFLLLILGTLGAVAAVRSGSAQKDAVLETPTIGAALEEHAEAGELTMWFFLGLSVARAGLLRLRKFSPAAHWLILLVWLVGLGALARAAHFGGEMVYMHGAGVSASGTERR